MSVVMDSVAQTVESWRAQGIAAEVVHRASPDAVEHSADLEPSGIQKDGMEVARYIIVHPTGCDCDYAPAEPAGAAPAEPAPPPVDPSAT